MKTLLTMMLLIGTAVQAASHYSFDRTPVYESVLAHLNWIRKTAKEMGSVPVVDKP